MNCPNCGVAIPAKAKGVGVACGVKKYQEDVERAWAAIGVLTRQPYPHLAEACEAEMIRLRMAIEKPEKLYAIYRRADKKTPIAYGMVTA